MKLAPRDGVWLANGLSADFRFIRADGPLSLVETVAGEFWANDAQLFYDPPRDALQWKPAPPQDVAAVVGADATNRNWPEDFHLENGQYQCRCVFCYEYFRGHKRRFVCKLCDKTTPVVAKEKPI